MSQMFYVSLQFSAIQKTICRVDRLWSMAGMSRKLAALNEVELPKLSEEFGGETLIAGGGKFTARFKSLEQAGEAQSAFKHYISTSFPMLEYQICAKPVPGDSLESLMNRSSGIMFADLFNQKRFRGYAVSYPPHILLCSECGEYPATHYLNGSEKNDLCDLCAELKQNNKLNELYINITEDLPTAGRIYARYKELLNSDLSHIKIPLDFSDMVASKGDEEEPAQKMAIWFADVNNLGKKVTAWLSVDELELHKLFQQVKDVFVEICAQALCETFSSLNEEFLPFRIIIAGGDDLCIAMQEKYALRFTEHISKAVQIEISKINAKPQHPLSEAYLKEKATVTGDYGGPYCLGASFVISNVHIPFRRLHELGEELMKNTKITTERKANGVNWRVLCGDTFIDNNITYDKPLYVTKNDVKQAGKVGTAISLEEYREVATRLLENDFSNSQFHSIGQQLLQNPTGLERWLALRTDVEVQRDSKKLLDEELLFDNAGKIIPKRVATLLDVLQLVKKEGEEG